MEKLLNFLRAIAAEVAKGSAMNGAAVAETLRQAEAFAGSNEARGYSATPEMVKQLTQLRADIDAMATRQAKLERQGLSQGHTIRLQSHDEIRGLRATKRVFGDHERAEAFGAYALSKIFRGHSGYTEMVAKRTRDMAESLAKDLDPAISGSGLELVPTIYVPDLIEHIEAAGVLFPLCTRVPITTLGQQIWPRLTAGLTFTPVAAAAAIAKTSPTFDTVTMTPCKWATYCPIPNEMLKAPAMLAALGQRIAYWLTQAAAEAADNALAVGDGTATYGNIIGVLAATGTSGFTTITAVSDHDSVPEITAADIDAVIAGITKTYLKDLRFTMHLSSERALRALRSTVGTPLYERGSNGEPNTIDGFPYTISQKFPLASGVGATTLWAAFGDWRTAYLFGEMGGLEIASSSDVLFLNDMTCLRGLMHIGAAIQDVNAMVTCATYS